MTHKPRQQSESGFYHVVTKGDGAQIVFESDRDRIRYLQKLADACDDFGTIIHAYCLMSNHVHLLVQDPKQNLGYFMKQLNERYAMYFRTITGRVGHIFQRPYWSEPIKTDEHFLWKSISHATSLAASSSSSASAPQATRPPCRFPEANFEGTSRPMSCSISPGPPSARTR